MRVELKREPDLEVVAARHRTQTGNVEVRSRRVATHLAKQGTDRLLRLGMVDEPRLEVGEDRGVLRRRHVILRELRLVRREGLFAQPAGKRAQRGRPFTRCMDEQIPGIQATPPLVVGARRVRVHSGHEAPFFALSSLASHGSARSCPVQRCMEI